MFVLTTIVDTIRIPPHMLSVPTKIAVHREMDIKYSNRVLMDVGLIICRYGDCLSIGDGVCVAGEGGAHHECVVRLVVFRPFVEEVCLGTIAKSSEEGIRVSLGEFFDDIFIPAYWMLRPSHFEADKRIWVWTPQYGEEEEGEKDESQPAVNEPKVKTEEEGAQEANEGENEDDGGEGKVEANDEEESRFEMEIGAEIRFRVKSINFTQVTTTAKGVQATTTTTTSQMPHNSLSIKNEANATSDGMMNPPVRKRSLSVEISDSQQAPASMHIVASICEDGLGLINWWTAQADDDGDEEGETGEE